MWHNLLCFPQGTAWAQFPPLIFVWIIKYLQSSKLGAETVISVVWMSNWIDKGVTFCTCITTYWTYACKIPICVHAHACDSNLAVAFFLPVTFFLQFYLPSVFCLEDIWPWHLCCVGSSGNTVQAGYDFYTSPFKLQCDCLDAIFCVLLP